MFCPCSSVACRNKTKSFTLRAYTCTTLIWWKDQSTIDEHSLFLPKIHRYRHLTWKMSVKNMVSAKKKHTNAPKVLLKPLRIFTFLLLSCMMEINRNFTAGENSQIRKTANNWRNLNPSWKNKHCRNVTYLWPIYDSFVLVIPEWISKKIRHHL